MGILDDIRNLSQGSGLLGTGTPPPLQGPPAPASVAAPPPPNAPQIGFDIGAIFGGQAPSGEAAGWGPPMTGPNDPDPNHKVVWEGQGKPAGQMQTSSTGMKYLKNQDGTTTVYPGGEGTNPVTISKDGVPMGNNLSTAIGGFLGGLGKAAGAKDPYVEMGAKQQAPPPQPQPQQPSSPSPSGGSPLQQLGGAISGGGAASALAGMSPEQLDAIARQYGYVKQGSQPSAMPTATGGALPQLGGAAPKANWQGGGMGGATAAPKTATSYGATPTTAVPTQATGMEAATPESDPSIETLIAAINGEQMQDDAGNVVIDFSGLDEGLRLAIAYGIVSYAQQQSQGQSTGEVSAPDALTADAGMSPQMDQIRSMLGGNTSSSIGKFDSSLGGGGATAFPTEDYSQPAPAPATTTKKKATNPAKKQTTTITTSKNTPPELPNR